MPTDPRVDADPDDGRDETEAERLDRNWTEILQELRVLQTGTQILTGFLLTLAFQPRFTELTAVQVDLYLALVVFAVLATILGLAPVSFHRVLFRRSAKAQIVASVNVIMHVTLGAVALLLAGTAALVFDVALGTAPAVIAAVSALALIAALWVVLPTSVRRRIGEPSEPTGSRG